MTTRSAALAASAASASNTVGELSVVQTEYKWVIHDFCTRCKNLGDFIRSPKFSTVHGAEKIFWHMELNPEGDEDSNKDWLSLFLTPSLTTRFKVTVTFKILNGQNEVAMRGTLDEHIFTKNWGWGLDRFACRRSIIDPKLDVLTDGKLTIVCVLVVNANKEKEDISGEKNALEQLPELRARLRQLRDAIEDKDKDSTHDSLRLKELDELEQLIGESKFSDVELSVEGKTIRAHRCILAKKSPVFAAMFQTEIKNIKCVNKVEIQDIKYGVFAELLRYVYSCKVTGIETMAVELLAAAERYSIDGLKVMCERAICSSLSVDNAVKSLGLAERHHLDELGRNAFNFIVQHVDDIVDRPEFQHIGLDVTRKILRAVVEKQKPRAIIDGV